jgi:hypothetical protein
MPAPVHLNVWHPVDPNTNGRVPESSPLFIHFFPHEATIRITSDGLNSRHIKRCVPVEAGLEVWWVANFPGDGIPVELHIRATPEDTSAWTEACHVCVLLRHVPAFGPVTISYPTGTQGNPTPVGANFGAYGFVDNTTVAAAYLQLNGAGAQIAGTVMTPGPPGYDGGASFTNWGGQAGSAYQLTVTPAAGAASTSWVQLMTGP